MPLALFLLALVVAGCGASEGDPAPTDESVTPTAAAFPKPDGRTLDQIAGQEGEAGELVVAPSVQTFHTGKGRFGFGVFTLDRGTVSNAQVALCVAQPNKPAKGPYPAAEESLAVKAPFQSRGTATDPEAAKAIYAADVKFDRPGEWQVLALVKSGEEEYTYASGGSALVGAFPDVPVEGEKAPKIETLTADDVGGDLSEIDTRQPPSTMHEDDFADVVGKEPIVLLFASPELCRTRVCGPVVDIAEQVKAERGDEAAFIMQEIYKDNIFDPENLTEQVEAYNLESEPWLFVIGTDGKISTALEGAFSEGELNAALDKVK